MRIRIDAMGQTKSEYFINDYLGSPIVVADAVTNTVNYQQYQDPFGNLESSIGVPSSNPEFRYTDKEYEEDQDLFYFAARYYDPVAGRFWGRDPVKIEEKENNLFHMNPYIYANNNPVINIDPDGREVFYDNKNQTVNPELTNLLNRLDTKVFVDWDIRVYSGKRSAEQNQNAKGGKDSLHLLGDAADIQIVKRDKNGKIIESMNYTTAAIGSYKAGVPRIITYSGRQENGTIHIDLGTSKLTTPGDMLRAIPQKDGSYKYEKNRDSKYWEPIIEKYREIRVNTINKLKEK